MLQRQRNKGARKRRERGCARHAAQKPSTQGQMHPRLRLMMHPDWTHLLAHGARVMLTSNLWTGFGLVNGAMGKVIAICYKSGQAPRNLPVSVMLRLIPTQAPHFLTEQSQLSPSACGLTFVACSRVRTLTDLLFKITPQL